VTARKDVQAKLKALKVAKAQLEDADDDDDTVALERMDGGARRANEFDRGSRRAVSTP
jgi:hypothetical protein